MLPGAGMGLYSLLLCLLLAACLEPSSARVGNSSCTPKTYPETGSLPQAVNFTTTLREIYWLGFEGDADKYVFAITEGEDFVQGGELWRSDRYGAADSWKNMTDELEGLFETAGRGGYIFRGAYALHYHFSNPEKILVQGAGNLIWTTDNFGANWRRLSSPGGTMGFWTEYKTHPNQQDWLLALVRRHECFHEQAKELDKWCQTDLFMTQDFGITWTNLTENSAGRVASFVDYDWGASFNWHHNESTHKDETIFATVYEDPKHMKGPLPSWDRNVHYIVSRDFFKTNHEKLVSCGNQFDIVSKKVYLAVPNNCPYGPEGKKRRLSAEDRVSSSVILYVSDDEGLSFTEACLPHGDLDLGYQMHGAMFGQGAYLMLRHEQESVAAANAPVSSVYSGGDSSLFTVGASRVFRRGRHVDYVGIDGLPGMYISNRLGLQALTDAAFHYGADSSDFEKYVETHVSFSGGAHWHNLEAPRNVTYPQCDMCSQMGRSWGCQLHLHGPSSWAAGEGKVPQLHSHWSAPGIVMAVGNVGEYLSFAKDYTCTFLSRDGGESWQDIDSRAMAFEFGDHGGILMMAPHQSEEPTDQVLFSQDEGACWHTIQLDEAIDVIGIKVEPTAASHIFLVYGEACFRDEAHPKCTHTEAGQRPQGKLFSLDLEHLLGNEWQVCNDDAYEQWSVPTPERCLLGRNITAHRRKRDAACFNSKGWERPQGLNESCDCTAIDTECDFGYEWSWHDEECRPMAGFDVNTCPHVKDHSYVISKSGKRLLAGDACFNISAVINDTDGRGHSTLPRHWHIPHWLGIATGLLVAAAVILGVMQIMGNSQAGSNIIETVAGPFVSGYDWLRDKITGGRGSQDYFQPLSEQ